MTKYLLLYRLRSWTSMKLILQNTEISLKTWNICETGVCASDMFRGEPGVNHRDNSHIIYFRVKELKNSNDQLVEMNDLLKEELMNSEQISKALIGELDSRLIGLHVTCSVWASYVDYKHKTNKKQSETKLFNLNCLLHILTAVYYS